MMRTILYIGDSHKRLEYVNYLLQINNNKSPEIIPVVLQKQSEMKYERDALQMKSDEEELIGQQHWLTPEQKQAEADKYYGREKSASQMRSQAPNQSKANKRKKKKNRARKRNRRMRSKK